MDEEKIRLQEAISGDASAFGNLVEAYSQSVFNLCYRMLGDPFEAEDAAQETFIRAYKSLKRYDSERPFSTWVLSIAAHYCIDQLRRRKMKLVPFEALPYEEIRDPSPNPEVNISITEDQEQIRRLLDMLGPTDRAAIVMFYWYEFSYDEISDALQISLSAVKSRLHRARRTLAQSWSESSKKTLNQRREYHESPAI